MYGRDSTGGMMLMRLWEPKSGKANIRPDINWLLKEDKPCVLVDHVPHVYENVDLQLSGHTHAGQILPLGFVLDTGLHKTEQGYRITSSGAGAWGMKNRLGSKCEIVFINLHS